MPVNKVESPFRPIADASHFPLLSANTELPCADLMGCENVAFFSPVDLSAVRPVIGHHGTEWHLYGDTRWPDAEVWTEFCTTPGGYDQPS